MQRLLSDTTWIVTAQGKWQNAVRKILAQVKLDAKHNSRLRDVLQEDQESGKSCLRDGSIGEMHGKTINCTFLLFYTADNPVIAFAALPYLLPDTRHKASHDKVLYFTEVYMGMPNP